MAQEIFHHFAINFFLKIISKSFLVACYATLHPAVSVRRSVGPSVTLDVFAFFSILEHTAT